ncbi:histone-like nucleoid-structuring protein Lsr2 [Streptomyces chartreusis]|uniref:Lsr2 family DNA-binding protein n=1 Tax=Streptomyces chartreusis TaxID=1969 RepID=UPI0036CA3C89
MNAYTAVIMSAHRGGQSAQQIAEHLSVPVEEIDATIAAHATEDIAETMPEVADLLAWAAAHNDEKVRADGGQAAAVLAALRERRAVDAELEKITNEENQLEERLAALRARKGTLQSQPASGKRRRSERDYDPKTVRAWGRENGYEVPDRARIPKKVLDAWRHRNSAPGPLPAAS